MNHPIKIKIKHPIKIKIKHHPRRKRGSPQGVHQAQEGHLGERVVGAGVQHSKVSSFIHFLVLLSFLNISSFKSLPAPAETAEQFGMIIVIIHLVPTLKPHTEGLDIHDRGGDDDDVAGR